MKDIKAIEKALLIGIVREQNWNVIIYNDIKRDYFSYENRALYDYIEKYTKVNKYPDLPLLQFEFQIPDDEMMELANIGELDNLCKTIANDYFKHRIEYELGELNEDISKGAIEENPLEFVHKMTQAVNDLELLGTENQSVGLFDNIEEILKIDPNDVISTGFKELDEKLIGFKRGEELITIVGRTGQGKEQPLSSKILTPNGWKLMKDIQVGDFIFAGNGDVTKVSAIFPQGNKDVYRITFNDRTYAECGLEHLWKVKERRSYNKSGIPIREEKVLTLAQMLNHLDKYDKNSKQYKQQYAIDYIPANIEFNSQLTSNDIHPYILGALLGDGCFVAGTEVRIACHEKDTQIIDTMNKFMPIDYYVHKTKGKNEYNLIRKHKISYQPVNGTGRNDIYLKLNDLGLIGCKSNNKFIPKKYLYSSLKERIWLLKGLTDTDGYARNSNYQQFDTVSYQLALDFMELIRSLGGKASYIKRPTHYQKDNVKIEGQTRYCINYSLDFNPYNLERKRNRWKSFRQVRTKFIVNIEKVRQEECQCIMLDHPEHTYITDDYTITHNTWIGLKFAWAASLQGERVGIYSGEMSVQQLQERILCCAKETYTSTKEDALKFILDRSLDIRILTQADLRRKANIRDIENFIVKNNLTMLIVDQLSLMEDITSKPGTPLRQQYGNISMDLFTMSSKYSLPCVLLAQSNRQGGQELNAPGLENIAESDAVAQNSTRVISMRNENGILTLSIVKNRYGESGLTQKYEVDYGINKYKPVRELQQEVATARKAKARQIFGGGASF